MRKRIVMLVLLLAACATPENRIESRLVEAGLGERSASCIADELTDRLSIGQLRRLSDFVKSVSGENRVERLTLGQLANRLGGIGDPAIVSAVTRAGLGCAIIAD
jgi:hypothetical protein